MRKLMMAMMAVVLTAGIASAVPIWSDDFSSFEVTGINLFPIPIDDDRDDKWISYSATPFIGTNAVGQAVISTSSGSNAGRTRAGIYAMNSLTVAGESDTTASSDFYQLSLDVINLSSNATFVIKLYDAYKVPGDAANAYAVDGSKGLNVALTGGTAIGTGEFNNTPLATATYSFGDEGTGKTIDFDWDGTGDLVMVYEIRSSVASTQSVTMDNLNLQVIPEPATFGLMAAFGGAMMLIRRRFRI